MLTKYIALACYTVGVFAYPMVPAVKVKEGHQDIEARASKFEVFCTATVAGGTALLGVNAGIDIYQKISDMVKDKSDHEDCEASMIMSDGTQIWYQATGACSTTASKKAIMKDIKNAQQVLHNKGVSAGCMKMNNKGTYNGLLKFSADGVGAEKLECPDNWERCDDSDIGEL